MYLEDRKYRYKAGSRFRGWAGAIGTDGTCPPAIRERMFSLHGKHRRAAQILAAGTAPSHWRTRPARSRSGS
jgi:hypothetical protein